MDQIIKDLHSIECSPTLQQSLSIIKSHIDYCKNNHINMWNDPLLSKVLIFR